MTNTQILKKLIYIIIFLIPVFGNSQNISLLDEYRDSIKTNALLMLGAQNYQQKLNYSDKVSKFVKLLIKQEKSINYRMDSTSLVKVLTSKNKYLRIFTWVVPTDENTYVFKGIVQTYSKSKKNYRIIELKDNTKHTTRPYSRILTAEKWYGAYYYKLIQLFASKSLVLEFCQD